MFASLLQSSLFFSPLHRSLDLRICKANFRLPCQQCSPEVLSWALQNGQCCISPISQIATLRSLVLGSAQICKNMIPWYIITVWMYYYMFYHFNKLCVCVFICILYTCTSTSYTYLYIPHEGPFGPAEAGWCHSRNKHRGRLSQLQWKWCSHLGGRYPIDEAGRWTDDTRNFMKLLLLLKLHTSTEQSDLTGMSTSPTIETLIIKFKMLI